MGWPVVANMFPPPPRPHQATLELETLVAVAKDDGSTSLIMHHTLPWCRYRWDVRVRPQARIAWSFHSAKEFLVLSASQSPDRNTRGFIECTSEIVSLVPQEWETVLGA